MDHSPNYVPHKTGLQPGVRGLQEADDADAGDGIWESVRREPNDLCVMACGRERAAVLSHVAAPRPE